MKKGLGRGLDALLGANKAEDVISDATYSQNSDSVVSLKITDVEPNKNQPRKEFDEEKLDELAQSIREHGVITPILVTKSKNGFYSIVAGERRWRAAKKAGIKQIPAIVKELTDAQISEIALIENLQREDLNPVEEALGYKRLMEEFSLTQDQVSERLGKSRSTVANALRLLNLSKDVIELLKDGKLSVGHAKVILSVKDKDEQFDLANKIIEGDMSVRATEQMIKQKAEKNPPEKKVKKKTDLNLKLAFEAIEKSMSSSLGTKVSISDRGGKGVIKIEYYSKDELERITKILDNF